MLVKVQNKPQGNRLSLQPYDECELVGKRNNPPNQMHLSILNPNTGQQIKVVPDHT